MPVIPVLVKSLPAFGNSQIIIIATCFPDIKEIGSPFTRPDPLTVNTFHLFVIIFVRHFCNFYFWMNLICVEAKIKLFFN